MELIQLTLAISLGAMAAIVYALRFLTVMDKKLSLLLRHHGIRETH